MIRKQYPPEFEEFWKIFDLIPQHGLGEKGNKAQAFKRYQQKKIGPDDFDYIRDRLLAQIDAKLARRASGAFDPDFMHVQGWLNNERWDDEISTTINRQPSASDRADQALRDYLSTLA